MCIYKCVFLSFGIIIMRLIHVVYINTLLLFSHGERCHESERQRKSHKTWWKRSCSSVSELREETERGHRENVEFGENTVQKSELWGAKLD